MNDTLNLNLEKLGSRVYRIISGGTMINHIPKISSIHRKRCCTYVYKCLQHEVCENFIGYFEVVSSKIGTRNQGLLIRVPKVKLEVARKGFFFMGGKYFNDLPHDIRNAVSLKVFKHRLHKYLF